MSEKTCTWSQNKNGVYETECGKKYEFVNDGPIENGIAFCCYCGKKLVEERMVGFRFCCYCGKKLVEERMESACTEVELEQGEFTKELRKICEEEKEDPEPFLEIELVLEACVRIDRLTANLTFTKQELAAANLEIKKLKKQIKDDAYYPNVNDEAS